MRMLSNEHFHQRSGIQSWKEGSGKKLFLRLSVRKFLVLCFLNYDTGVYRRMPVSFVSSVNVTCSSGFLSLLSCGIDNSQTTQADPYRAAIPINSTTCQCLDSYGAKCVVRCYSDLINNFQIVRSPGTGFLTGYVYATCPDGSYVLGCHANPNPYVAYDAYRRSYPSSNTTCTCMDSSGVQCIATCASNVRNHEIKSATGSGTFLVSCSPSKFVLGCGMNTTGNGVDLFRTSVVNGTACQCKDDYGTTCYAVCGRFQ